MYRDLIGAFALDAVSRDEALAIESHLDECDSCRAEVGSLRSVVSVIPLSVEEVEPPASLRGSLLAAVMREPNVRQAGASQDIRSAQPPPPVDLSERRARRQWLPWAAAAAMLLVSLGLLGWNLSLRDSSEAEPWTVALLPTSSEITAGGEAAYHEDTGVMVISLHDLPEVAPDQVYQVWMIDATGPVSAGVLQPGESEFAVAIDPDDYRALAITEEQGPLGVPAPTSEPILKADLQTT